MSTPEARISWPRQVIRGNVLVLGVVSLLTDASSEMIYPLIPVFMTGIAPLAVAPVYLGLMEGAAEAVASLLKIVSGRASDRARRRKVFAVIGYGISAVCRPAMALARVGWHPVVLRFLDRVGKGIRTSPRDALISDSVGADVRGVAFSFHRAMDHAGAILGSLSSVLVLYALLGHSLWKGSQGVASADEMHAMRILFGLALLPGFLSFVTLTSKARDVAPPKLNPETPDGAAPPLPRKFYLFLGIVTLFALGNSSDLFLLYYGVTRFGLGLAGVVGLWVALHLSKMVFSLPGGLLSDRLGRRFVITAGWAVYAGVYAGMTTVSSSGVFWALVVSYGAYYGLTEGAEKALIADYVASAHRGRAYGLYHGAIGLAALPASLVFGMFWAQLGPARAFSIGAGLAGAAMLLLLLLLASDARSRRSLDFAHWRPPARKHGGVA